MKNIGGSLYVHKNYKHKLPIKIKEIPYEYNILKYNTLTRKISYIYCPEFDTQDEPIIKDIYILDKLGNLKNMPKQKDPFVYHHKWMFVDKDYSGFDYQKSKARSEAINALKINKLKIGRLNFWKTILEKFNHLLPKGD